MLRKLARTLMPRKLLRFLYARGFGAGLIGMTSVEEQAYYKDAAAKLCGKSGAIVDLGCWMCSTSISLAEGLRSACSSGNTDSRVYAFDRFVWASWMDGFLPKVSRDYKAGESFLDEARQRIRDYQEIIELMPADLTQYRWDRGPIKLLLVDTMKTWALAKTVTKSFFPSLMKESILIHQDYKHYYTPWIHLLQYRLKDYFQFFHEVSQGGTVAFRTLESIPEKKALQAVDFSKITDKDMESAIQYSMQFLSEDGRATAAAAHVMYFIHCERIRDAGGILEAYLKSGMTPNESLRKIASEIAKFR